VIDALSALELIELGILKEKSFDGINALQARAVITKGRREYERRLSGADKTVEQARKELEAAEEREQWALKHPFIMGGGKGRKYEPSDAQRKLWTIQELLDDDSIAWEIDKILGSKDPVASGSQLWARELKALAVRALAYIEKLTPVSSGIGGGANECQAAIEESSLAVPASTTPAEEIDQPASARDIAIG
jgi:hypothetical protein